MKVEVKNKSSLKTIIFNIVNVLLLIAILFFINRIPKLALEAKSLNSELIVAQESSGVAILKSDIERNLEKIESIESSFTNESKFLEFISEIENVRAGGILTEFNFPVANPVVDSTGNPGFPIAFALRGSQNDVNNEVSRLFGLDYVLRPTNLSIEIAPEGDIITLRMGTFLYINEEFKN